MDHCSKSSLREINSPFDCLLFDLDDTLYASTIGIAAAVKRNIEDFLVEKCGFPKVKASSLRIELFRTYGSTLAGLRALGYDIEADDYHSFVHGRLPYEVIKADLQLCNLLHSINQRKIIFTNSDRNHAMKVLEKLGLHDCFDQIICFETINPNLSKSTRLDEFPVVLKPSIDAMNIALNVANVDPCRTLFLDDNDRNIAAGKSVGLRTALVGKLKKSKEADYALESILNLRQVIPEIWIMSSGSDPAKHQIKRTRSEIDSVLPATPVGA
ncbi:Haloacid dehalogenase-like hydrolase (HAD) superfamily protein [Thalictrum thalictroides]|uniref:Haloacid dehalogenase-like hydrolase (HAD) superfamily protein n=1 Tax=Thalictrum thalictroides TaxID=46969 RepID=A0A7J6X6M6_THATH|nr:Haloacid dehalogenase-like hydrolase (HAD) superfamily protein [Thalictrum thalictroides]